MEAKLKRLGMGIVLYLEGIDDDPDADDGETECLIEKMNTCTPKTSRIKIPSMVRMFLQEGTCPYGGEEQGAGQIFILRDGTAQIRCSGCTKVSIAELDPKNHKKTREFMEHFWGRAACIQAMNKRFVQVARGRRIVEYDNSSVVCVYSQAEWLTFHKGHTDLDQKEMGPVWLASLERAQCRDLVFDASKPFGIIGGNFNEYSGFAVTPSSGGGEICDIVIGANRMMLLLDCLARLIQRPWEKLGVHLAWWWGWRDGAGGANSSDLVVYRRPTKEEEDLADALVRIFGKYAKCVTTSCREKVLHVPEKILLVVVSVVSVDGRLPIVKGEHVTCVIFLICSPAAAAMAAAAASHVLVHPASLKMLPGNEDRLLRCLLERVVGSGGESATKKIRN